MKWGLTLDRVEMWGRERQRHSCRHGGCGGTGGHGGPMGFSLWGVSTRRKQLKFFFQVGVSKFHIIVVHGDYDLQAPKENGYC